MNTEYDKTYRKSLKIVITKKVAVVFAIVYGISILSLYFIGRMLLADEAISQINLFWHIVIGFSGRYNFYL